MREKERRGSATILFPHLCFKVAPRSSQRVSYVITFIYQWEFFIIELRLYIPMMGFLKSALGLREQASWMHPTSFLLLSFHIFIALVHPLHGNPYSLTLISINGHLHSPLIRLVDVRLSSPFCLLHNHHSIPHIVLCPWLTLMYCVKVERV